MTTTPHPKRLTAAQLRVLKQTAQRPPQDRSWFDDFVLSAVIELLAHRAAARRGQRTRRTGTKRKGSK